MKVQDKSCEEEVRRSPNFLFEILPFHLLLAQTFNFSHLTFELPLQPLLLSLDLLSLPLPRPLEKSGCSLKIHVNLFIAKRLCPLERLD